MVCLRRVGFLFCVDVFLATFASVGRIAPVEASEWIDLSNAVVVVRGGDRPNAERSAATALIEEVHKRTGVQWRESSDWPEDATVIAVTATQQVPEWGRAVPKRDGDNLPETLPEGFRIHVERAENQPPVVWVQGADPRGALFGVGALLRNLKWGEGVAMLPGELNVATAPVSPIRGHQLGYRARANSWDAWTEQQFDQYIRELALFGTNAIENIPFQDPRSNPMMKFSRRELNQKMSRICDRYGLDYWVWTPAEFDLSNEKLRGEMLDKHETLYRDCQRLDGVFFPAGDPGDNPPELVLPFLEELSQRLIAIHPDTRIWLSLQQMDRREVDYVFETIQQQQPAWLGGLVAGPSSPPIAMLRNRLPSQYKVRLYPDITHNKLCQYEVPWWDPAYAVTLGREAINPRPREYAQIHNQFADYSDGFISYSDGVHDDVNKVVWSMLGWDPDRDVRQILIEYCRFFFDANSPTAAADGILSLETNWQGALAENGSVESTLLAWSRLERRAPQLHDNWRWQMCLLRANFDAFVRRRLIYETELEHEANRVLAEAPRSGSQMAMKNALEVLHRTRTESLQPPPARADRGLVSGSF